MIVRLLTLLISVVNISVLAQRLWPKNTNGSVTIPYFFHDPTIPIGDTRRNTFQKAVEVYRTSTCIEWEQVAQNETPGHVVVLDMKQGCGSHVGMLNESINYITMSTKCNSGIMIHEMDHALGMDHTHQRPDRDNYVEIWKDNIKRDNLGDFRINPRYRTFGVPYDYLSMMHYPNLFYSSTKLYTITPKNRLALFAMGSKREFRWSDTAWINRAYNCESFFLKTCKRLNCTNGGYVGKDCKCNCPENTKGRLCETITGDLFNEEPGCGGIVKTEGEIRTYGVKECVYQIIAPRCQIPQIIVTEAVFKTKLCGENRLILHFLNAGFGHVYCDRSKIPFGAPMFSKTSEAAIYYTSSPGTDSNIGFTVAISFFKNLDWPSVNVTSQNPKANNPVVTLKGPCDLIQSADNSYIYSTPNFPSPVACYAECISVFNTTQNSSLELYDVSIRKQFTKDERLSLHDPVMNHIVTAFKPSLMLVLMWPFEVKFSGSDDPGKGFQVTLTPVKRVLFPCGEVLTLSVNETKTITNPLFKKAHPISTCIFKIEAERSHLIECSLSNLGTMMLRINTNFPNESEFVKAEEKTYKSTGNSIHFHYLVKVSKKEWSITCKAGI